MAELWDWDDPLARCPGETSRANAAFQDYIDLGPGRSLRELHRGYVGDVKPTEPQYNLFRRYHAQTGGETGVIPPTKDYKRLEIWSADHHWQARLARYEQMVKAKREAIRESRRQELEDQDWNNGGQLRQKVLAFLEELPRFLTDTTQDVQGPDGETIRVVTVKLNTTIAQLAQALRTGSDLQRLAVNEPTEITELHGAALLGRILSELDDLAAPDEASDPEQVVDEGTAPVPCGDSELQAAVDDPEGQEE